MPIGFPNLNLWITIDRIAFSICNIDIYWYGIIIALAYLLAVILIIIDTKKLKLNVDNVIILIVSTTVLGVFGARLFYIAFSPLELTFANILDFRSGGLAIYGGLIVGALTVYLLCKKFKYSFLKIADLVIPYICLGQCIGRIGNFINQEAYGIQTDVFWKMSIFSNGGYINVHPTFLYEMLITLSLFIYLFIKRKTKKIDGQLLSIYLIVYGVGRFIIESFRADSLLICDFKISQIVSVLIVLLGIVIAWFILKQGNKNIIDK